MNKHEIKQIIQSLNLRPVVFNPAYKLLTGSLHGGLLLSQIMYWYSATGRKFYKIDKELKNELYMTEREFKTAKNHVKQVKFLKITKEGIPCRTWYDVDFSEYKTSISLIATHLDKPVRTSLGGTVQTGMDKTVQTGIDETIPTITENTSEITHNNKYNKIFMDLKTSINSMYRRRETTTWDDKEIQKLKKISKRPEVLTEMAEIKELYDSGYEYRRRDIITFLNNWTGELDRARAPVVEKRENISSQAKIIRREDYSDVF